MRSLESQICKQRLIYLEHIMRENDLMLRKIIVLQCLGSLLMTIYSVLHLSGDFKEIRATVELENKSYETFNNRPSFYVFNHRGRTLSPTELSTS
ncbi:MMGT1 [Cordylochernes scorpioides]|uniref:MMGT1 n=1 Tax=Cordylochernes scorpioides TaxID=51811 RepID=A0ABY6KWV0_9ARAC|nr:MMGT1 [Cordylochernes scorpioides]